MAEFVLGYLTYLGMIFIPGVGIGELAGAWRDEDSLVERFGVALGVGLALDTLTLVIRTSGFYFFGFSLRGIEVSTVYFVIFIGVAALVASAAFRRGLRFPKRPTRIEAVVSAVIVSLSLLLWLYFQKYPIFPEYQSPDYVSHVQLAQGLLSGSQTSIPSGVFYYGVHYQLAASILLVGGEPLVVVQRTMATLIVLSPLLVYLVSVRLFRSSVAGLLSCVVYSFSGTIWFGSVFNSGLYANYFGVLVAFFLISSFIDIASPGVPRSTWLVFGIAVAATYFSHYTAVTVLGAVFLTVVLQAAFRRNDARPLVAPSIALLAPGAIVAVAYPRLVGLVFNLATQGGGSLVGTTTLADLFSPLPVLRFIALEITDDLATIVFLAFAVLFAIDALKKGSAGFSLPLLWLISLLVLAPLNDSAWRFSYEALVPLTLVTGYGISSVLQKEDQTTKREGIRSARSKRGSAMFILVSLLLILVGSWGQRTVENIASNSDVSAQAQRQVYSAIYWLGDNTPQNSRYLSVSDWRFTYTGLLIGRNTIYNFTSQPDAAIKLAKSGGLSYIFVTNLVTANLPPVPQLFPWNNFRNSSELSLVYNSSDVRVFKIASA